MFCRVPLKYLSLINIIGLYLFYYYFKIKGCSTNLSIFASKYLLNTETQ